MSPGCSRGPCDPNTHAAAIHGGHQHQPCLSWLGVQCSCFGGRNGIHLGQGRLWKPRSRQPGGLACPQASSDAGGATSKFFFYRRSPLPDRNREGRGLQLGPRRVRAMRPRELQQSAAAAAARGSADVRENAQRFSWRWSQPRRDQGRRAVLLWSRLREKLGQSSGDDELSPTMVDALCHVSIVAAAAGDEYSLALAEDDTVFS
jgi:hypothetical protein